MGTSKKLTPAELLERYKDSNPTANLATLNKAERQLYIGNIPVGIKSERLNELLNEKLRELGKSAGLFQEGTPVTGSWISGDGHYAFVDFRTAEEATEGFVLGQVQLTEGCYLKVGRPKNATGIIPQPSQLLCGNPNFNPANPGVNLAAKKTTSSSLVQQALK